MRATKILCFCILFNFLCQTIAKQHNKSQVYSPAHTVTSVQALFGLFTANMFAFCRLSPSQAASCIHANNEGVLRISSTWKVYWMLHAGPDRGENAMVTVHIGQAAKHKRHGRPLGLRRYCAKRRAACHRHSSIIPFPTASQAVSLGCVFSRHEPTFDAVFCMVTLTGACKHAHCSRGEMVQEKSMCATIGVLRAHCDSWHGHG